ncbi:uncharacterized protein LOC142172726 [Nicotiana tabacum]|uniref:Uncharacterized protein LOC142172726 n=1 Tax=Nicotiana tabacum TaxID=4097 RepID=A0AC58T5Q0_TOBAC
MKNKYPILLLADLFDRLGGAMMFTKIHLQIGYWQVRIAMGDEYKMTLPLTELLKKDMPWDWVPRRSEAFDALKKTIPSSFVLALPDWPSHSRNKELRQADLKEIKDMIKCHVEQYDEKPRQIQRQETERFNGMLEEYLRHFVTGSQKNWLKLLDAAQLCFNSPGSSSTNKKVKEKLPIDPPSAWGPEPESLGPVTAQESMTGSRYPVSALGPEAALRPKAG